MYTLLCFFFFFFVLTNTGFYLEKAFLNSTRSTRSGKKVVKKNFFASSENVPVNR